MSVAPQAAASNVFGCAGSTSDREVTPSPLLPSMTNMAWHPSADRKPSRPYSPIGNSGPPSKQKYAAAPQSCSGR